MNTNTLKYSRSKGRPLNSKELREITSTLSKEELKRFEAKTLFFTPDLTNKKKVFKGEGGAAFGLDIRTGSKCLSYIKKPIEGEDPNKSKFY